MKEVLELIAKELVDHPGQVSVTEEIKEGHTIVLGLKVAEQDMGKVIGKGGRVANSIRRVMNMAVTESSDDTSGEKTRVIVDIG